MIKIFFKEDWIPPFADRPVFVLAPAVIIVTVLMSLRRRAGTRRGSGSSTWTSACSSSWRCRRSGVYSVVLAGWSSNNKYALLGGLRAAAQMLSYEVFMGLSLMGVVLLAGASICGRSSRRSEGSGTDPAVPGLPRLSRRRTGRDASPALRPARGGERAGGRVPHRVLGDEVRDVLRRASTGDHPHLGPDLDALLRRLARPWLPPMVWFLLKTGVVHRRSSCSCARRCRGPATTSSWPSAGRCCCPSSC